MKHFIISFLLILFIVPSCQEKKENENLARPTESYDAVNTSMSDLKIYVRQLDSAVLQAAVMRDILTNPDSAKRAIRSRDQDMVRIYKPETTPILDTAAAHRDYILNEAIQTLTTSRQKIREANESLEIYLTEGTAILSERPELREAFQKEMENFRESINKAQEKADNLGIALDSIDSIRLEENNQ